jgi:1-acyl-sn-glycerol-3-phosphate acyltransferase
MHWVYYFGRVLIRILIFPFGSWEVKGRENVPVKGTFLIVCNHLSLADPPMVAASIPLKCVFMAKEELFRNRWPRFWVSNFGAIPVSRGGVDREAIRVAEDWLKKGVSLIIFPEGGRSKTASIQTAFTGAALIASRTGVPVLPVSISGTEKLKNMRLKPLMWCVFHRPKMTVNIGRPFQPSPAEGKLPKEQRQALMNEIMVKIAALLPPEYRGVYGENQNAHD